LFQSRQFQIIIRNFTILFLYFGQKADAFSLIFNQILGQLGQIIRLFQDIDLFLTSIAFTGLRLDRITLQILTTALSTNPLILLNRTQQLSAHGPLLLKDSIIILDSHVLLIIARLSTVDIGF
jgi:hypothetical protein